ncbi:CRISPR-associated helicase/endonuclease Cas3 [Aliagarivorans taiwanensis]|uniref:CRISPR-associated helicase/endonuclease Cas3 n=1 Tax=Aliagarivorans taiwanensis TaxID=561966 RepID=UPI0003FDD99D|nr:CRISPR-associated helicase/endonuclease Cas3 [Aliagarivorans taiwanensis]
MTELATYFKYWGKVSKDSVHSSADYHLLAYHSLDVAAVCFEWLNADKGLLRDLSEFLSVNPGQLKVITSFLIALHDLGKFSSAFQALAPQQFVDLITPDNRKPYDGRSYRHDRLGTWFWRRQRQNIVEYWSSKTALDKRQQRFITDPLNILMDCMLGHHGVPVEADEAGIEGFTEPCNLQAADEFVGELLELFKPEFPECFYRNDKLWLSQLKQVSWHIAGIAVLCDWLGSDQADFPYQSKVVPLEQYWNTAKKQAAKALRDKRLISVYPVSPFTSVKALFSFEPTPLQAWAEQVELTNRPQLFILEDVTGSGKTEAALTLTHRLMQQGVADGFYFGLPTMATSNAMFKRVAAHYLRMYEAAQEKPGIVLAHGAREMNPLFQEAVIASGEDGSNYRSDDQTASAECHSWLADSRKKALLAPVGVGTIDQALLAVLPKRHQSLRLLGLHRKVLIFDEVHAADEYMFELLEGLLQLHLHQGGSVILLTATLPIKQRQKLVDIWQQASGVSPTLTQKNSLSDFPLATQVTPGAEFPVKESRLSSREDVSRELKVTFVHQPEQCIERIIAATELGQCVVWVRNSVDDALAAYEQVSARMSQPKHCILFHSRFTLEDRNRIEAKVLKVFGKNTLPENRRGRVLIATQVFQESLDVDCDLMLSDLCPIDDLIQRAGRLHRHTRDENGCYQPQQKDQRKPPELIVHSPEWAAQPKADWLSKGFKNTSYVYPSAGRLWLGMRELKKLGAIRMPQEARQLIEAVYSDEAREQIPVSLIKQEQELLGKERARENIAYSRKLNWPYGYSATSGCWEEDEQEINTRLSEHEEVQVVLLKLTDKGGLSLWSDAPRFALQFSTLKLAKNKYADRLTTIPEQYQAQLEQLASRYPQLKYQQCWLPSLENEYIYQPNMGFYQHKPKEDQ